MQGQTIKEVKNISGEEVEIDGANLKPGLYFYVLTNIKTGKYSKGQLVRY